MLFFFFLFSFQWVVLVVEVRPNLLSGEPERLLLEDISQAFFFICVVYFPVHDMVSKD